MTAEMKLELAYLSEEVDRHGNVRLYFRRHGKRVRIREALGTKDFSDRYYALLAGQDEPAPSHPDRPARPRPDTYRWLCVAYMESDAFRGLDPSSQAPRKGILESTFLEPIYPGAKETFGDFPLDKFTRKHVRILRDRKRDMPGAANNRLKAIRAVFQWACKDGSGDDDQPLVPANPTRDVDWVRDPSTGHHMWTVDEVRQYEKRHPIGTKAHLAMMLIRCTGFRRSDLVRIGRQHRQTVWSQHRQIREPWFKLTAWKNRNRTPITLEFPILPELQKVLEASPVGDLTYLVTTFGKPFTASGFGNKFRTWCNEAGLPHCSAHGLRKAGATIAAENGASAHTLMAIFGWLTLQEAERYTRAADRRRLADQGMHLVGRTNEDR